MDLLVLLAELLMGLAFWVGVLVALAIVVRLAVFVRSLLSARTPAATPTPDPSSWHVTLLVDVDEETGLFRPSVQLRGAPVLWPAKIRLELVDQHGVVRRSFERPLPLQAVGREVSLPAFPPPERAGVDEVLHWHWDVVIADERRERARWREHPAPVGPLNVEAELELAGVAAFPEA